MTKPSFFKSVRTLTNAHFYLLECDKTSYEIDGPMTTCKPFTQTHNFQEEKRYFLVFFFRKFILTGYLIIPFFLTCKKKLISFFSFLKKIHYFVMESTRNDEVKETIDRK